MPPSLPDLLAELRTAFPRENVTADRLRLYLRELDDLPLDAVAGAVRELIRTRTSPYFPLAGEIRALVADRTGGLPGEPDALAQVEARVAWGRTDEDDRPSDPPAVHPLVKRALDLVGGWPAWRAADLPAVIRGQFLAQYRLLRADALRREQVGPALAAGPERRGLPRGRPPG